MARTLVPAARSRWPSGLGGRLGSTRSARRAPDSGPRTPPTDYGRTDTCEGRSNDPGPGSPVVMLMRVDVVRGMQNSAALTRVFPGVPGCPVRVMLPPPLVGKHGVAVLFEQQSWEMPPFASMQLPAGSVATHAAPVHVAVQLPAPQKSSCVCGPSESGQGAGPRTSSSRISIGWVSSMSSLLRYGTTGVKCMLSCNCLQHAH
jgi:hypothetical protein